MLDAVLWAASPRHRHLPPPSSMMVALAKRRRPPADLMEMKQRWAGRLGLHRAPMPRMSSFLTRSDLPENYSAHAHYPRCLSGVRNQRSCGSCYAFASLNMIAERKCIADEKTSGSGTLVILSEQDMVSCGSGDGDGKYPRRDFNSRQTAN